MGTERSINRNGILYITHIGEPEAMDMFIQALKVAALDLEVA